MHYAGDEYRSNNVAPTFCIEPTISEYHPFKMFPNTKCPPMICSPYKIGRHSVCGNTNVSYTSEICKLFISMSCSEKKRCHDDLSGNISTFNPIPSGPLELHEPPGLCKFAQHLFVGCSGVVDPKNGSQPHFLPRLSCPN